MHLTAQVEVREVASARTRPGPAHRVVREDARRAQRGLAARRHAECPGELLRPCRAVTEVVAPDAVGKIREGRERRLRRHPECAVVIAGVRQAVAEDHDPVERFGEPVRYGCEEHDTKRDREDDGRTATCQLDSHGALLLGPAAWRTLRLHAVVIHGRASRARHRAVTVANGRRRALSNGSVRGRGGDVRTR